MTLALLDTDETVHKDGLDPALFQQEEMGEREVLSVCGGWTFF